MLKRLYIDNIRSFSNFTLEPERVAVLVGPNGGGKSSVFRVLAALQEFLVAGQEATQVFGGSRTRWDERLDQKVELEAVGDNGVQFVYELATVHSPDGRHVSVQNEQLRADGKVIYRLTGGEVQLFGDKPSVKPSTAFPFVSTRSFIPLLEDRPDNQLIMSFRRWLLGVWLFAIRPQGLSATSDKEEASLVLDGTNFVSWYRVLSQEQPQVREQLLADLAPVISGLSEIRFAGGAGSSRKILTLECRLSSGAPLYSLTLGELSDGQRALLVLYTIKHMIARRASLLVFDEPDNFLAYSEIQPWLSGIRESVLGGAATLLVISHHPEVIDYLAPDQVLKLWREDGPTRVEEPKLDRSTGILASEALRLESP